MGRYTKRYDQFVLGGKPTFGIAPPPNIFAADLGEALVRGVLTGISTYGISGGASWLATHHIDWLDCVSWGFIVGGTIVALPIAGEVLAEFTGDIAEGVSAGWHRGLPEPEDEPEPEPAPPEPTEDEAGAARVPGKWWYYDARKQLKCYNTPTAPAKGTERPKPIISDARMQAIFTRIANGVPFSERRLCERDSKDHVPGLSGSQFRKLQDDWCNVNRGPLYIIRPDRSGYFTPAGKRIAEAIRTAEL